MPGFIEILTKKKRRGVLIPSSDSVLLTIYIPDLVSAMPGRKCMRVCTPLELLSTGNRFHPLR